MSFSTQHRQVLLGRTEGSTTTTFGQFFYRGFRIVLSAIAGALATGIGFSLGGSKAVGLILGVVVAGIVLAFLKYIDQGPTTA